MEHILKVDLKVKFCFLCIYNPISKHAIDIIILIIGGIYKRSHFPSTFLM